MWLNIACDKAEHKCKLCQNGYENTSAKKNLSIVLSMLRKPIPVVQRDKFSI